MAAAGRNASGGAGLRGSRHGLPIGILRRERFVVAQDVHRQRRQHQAHNHPRDPMAMKLATAARRLMGRTRGVMLIGHGVAGGDSRALVPECLANGGRAARLHSEYNSRSSAGEFWPIVDKWLVRSSLFCGIGVRVVGFLARL
jgi:hypothetical protein